MTIRFRHFEAATSGGSGEDPWPVSKSTILPGPDGPSELPDLLLGIARRKGPSDGASLPSAGEAPLEGMNTNVIDG